MASTSTTALYLSDTSTHLMNANLQREQRLKFLDGCKFCFICLAFFSPVIIFAGIFLTGMGAHHWMGLSDDFYEAFPESRSKGKNLMNKGICILVPGIIILMIGRIGIACCRCIKRNSLSTFSDTSVTTNAVAPNTVSALVEPPLMVELNSMPMNSYDPPEQMEFFQEIQTGSNQYPPVQRDFSGYPPAYPTINQYPLSHQAMAHLAFSAEMMPDAPPSYREVMAKRRYYTNAFAESEWV